MSELLNSRTLLNLNKVTFRYPGPSRTGVDLVSMELKEGEFVGVLGANGSGKSTLARLCCALLLPQSGEVIVDGLSTNIEENHRRIRHLVGLVFQYPDHQFVANTVASEIAFGLENQGLPSTQIRTKVHEILELFGLSSLVDTPPHLLSGGEKRKLTLASILILRPQVLLVDEPLAMLDRKTKNDVTRYLRKLKDDGTAILWFGHNLIEMAEADRVIVMNEGRIIWQGRPEGLLTIAPQARRWGITLPAPFELADEVSLDHPAIMKEEDLVSWIWK